jgi:hypothetical protein
MVLPEYVKENPDVVQALVTSFEEAGRLVYADPAYAKKVARLEFPDLPGDVVDKAIDAEIKYQIPAATVVTQADAWNKLMEMQKFLGKMLKARFQWKRSLTILLLRRLPRTLRTSKRLNNYNRGTLRTSPVGRKSIHIKPTSGGWDKSATGRLQSQKDL